MVKGCSSEQIYRNAPEWLQQTGMSTTFVVGKVIGGNCPGTNLCLQCCQNQTNQIQDSISCSPQKCYSKFCGLGWDWMDLLVFA